MRALKSYVAMRHWHRIVKDMILAAPAALKMKRCLNTLNTLILKNPIREHRIRRLQAESVRKDFSSAIEHLIVFLTPGYDFVNGGIMSICSLCRESQKLARTKGAAVVLCTMPTHPLLFKYTRFSNENHLYELGSILAYFKQARTLMIHIPELYVETFTQYFARRQAVFSRYDLHMNVLLQNIDQAPSNMSVDTLKKYGTVSCTTAHVAYSTPQTAERIGCEVHRLSTFVSPEQFVNQPYREKEDLMIVSPDAHHSKEDILGAISQQLPGVKIRVINGITYEEFKALISRAKWALTFGEGLDGYFIETIFSGGIGFAVYNERFFTNEFRELITVYPDYGSLVDKITHDIRKLDTFERYRDYQRTQYELLCKYYSYSDYVKNLENFYLRYYEPLLMRGHMAQNYQSNG